MEGLGSTMTSNEVARLEDEVLDHIYEALAKLRRARDILGSDPDGMGRHLSVAITKIEDARYRVQEARDVEGD
jgi:hypothetical protein